VDAIDKQMATHGSIGLATPAFNAILRAQEHHRMNSDLIAAARVHRGYTGSREWGAGRDGFAARSPCWPTSSAPLLVLSRHRRCLSSLRGMKRPRARFDACNRLLRTTARCLERAIVAQRRAIGVIAGAAATTVAPAGYGAPGSQGHVGRPAAFALPARA
jgi:hypothetical protein